MRSFLGRLLICGVVCHTILGRAEVMLPGLSVHFGKAISEFSQKKLDDGEIFVFNPGIGFGHGFREDSRANGFR